MHTIFIISRCNVNKHISLLGHMKQNPLERALTEDGIRCWVNPQGLTQHLIRSFIYETRSVVEEHVSKQSQFVKHRIYTKILSNHILQPREKYTGFERFVDLDNELRLKISTRELIQPEVIITNDCKIDPTSGGYRDMVISKLSECNHITLLLSGGIDSEFIAQVLFAAKIKFTPVIYEWIDNVGVCQNEFDIKWARQFCVERNINPIVITICIPELWKMSVFRTMMEKLKHNSPQTTTHYFMVKWAAERVAKLASTRLSYSTILLGGENRYKVKTNAGNDDQLLAGSSSYNIYYASKWSDPDGSGFSYWVATLKQGAEYTILRGVCTDNFGYVYVTGQRGSDLYLAKYNASGTRVWEQRYAGAHVMAGAGVDTDNSGNVYVVVTSASGTNMYPTVMKLNSTGTILWQRHYKQTSYAYAVFTYCVVHKPSNSLYTVGTIDRDTRDSLFIMKFDQNGNNVFQRTFRGTQLTRGNSIDVDWVGNVYSVGYGTGISTSTTTGADGLLIKMNSSGDILWQRGFIHSNFDQLYGVVVDRTNNDNIYVTGSNSQTPAGVLVAKLTASGELKWKKFVEFTALADIGIDIDTDANGNVHIIASGNGGSTQYFSVSLDSNGNLRDTLKYAGGTFNHMVIDRGGEGLYIVGTSTNVGNIIKTSTIGSKTGTFGNWVITSVSSTVTDATDIVVAPGNVTLKTGGSYVVVDNTTMKDFTESIAAGTSTLIGMG